MRQDDVDALIDAMCGTVLTHLSGMAAHCSRDLAVRRNIDAVVDQVRRVIAAACLAQAEEWNEPPLDEQCDLAETIDIERDGLRDMLEAVAAARETAAEAQRDHGYAEAVRSIRLIASTLHQVDDAVMVDVAMINEASDGMASKLITARLHAIGFRVAAGWQRGGALFDAMIEKVRRRRLQ